MDPCAEAERLLGEAWGAPVSCEMSAALRHPGWRNGVWRLVVRGGPAEHVIVKACFSEGGGYAPSDRTPVSAFQRLANEWCGAAMLGPLGLGPKIIAGDMTSGVVVLEDLGGGHMLADVLRGNDPVAAEVALFAYARSLGDLHAATVGSQARWASLQAARGASPVSPLSAPFAPLMAALPTFCEAIEIAPPGGLADDVAAIVATLDDPGAYLAFTPADCCPDNHFLRGERVQFFDCERAAMRHALLDAAYLLAPFPTCWCCAALPADLPVRLLAAYRGQFPGGPDFEDQMTLILAAWVITRIGSRGGVDWLQADRPWGLSSVRQRVRAVTGNLLARPNLASLLPAFAALMAEADSRLAERWPDLAPMALYPAFA
ncbi:MAG TPA: hypothetical protein VGL58_03585 [Caulobacteraceae bacterium]